MTNRLLNIAVTQSSEDLVIQAGAARIGQGNPAWPNLPLLNNIVDGKASEFVNRLFGKLPPPTSIDDLADYLVLSTCGHNFEGWRYLSQSALALLSGARAQAIHLAYYAELRAALSILGGSGIGILNGGHFSISQSGNVYWFKGGTHEVAWEALSKWSKDVDQARKVITCFETFGVSAFEWAEACNASASVDAIAADWLRDWSFDLNLFRADRALRNVSSYQPNLSSSAFNRLDVGEVRFLRDAASICSPIGNGSLASLDTVLMYDLCLKACQLRYGTADKASMKAMAQDIVVWLSKHKYADDKRSAGSVMRSVFEAARGEGATILSSANSTNSEATGVISRALLLLRLATALMRRQWDLIRRISPSGISPWQDTSIASYGVVANLFEPGYPRSDYALLDEDRALAQESLDTWLRVTTFNAYQLTRAIPLDLVELCRFERVGLMAAIV